MNYKRELADALVRIFARIESECDRELMKRYAETARRSMGQRRRHLWKSSTQPTT